MTQEPEERAAQAEEEEVVDAEVVSAADPATESEESAEASVEQDLNALVEEARSQRDEYLQLAQRTKADFDNYRKRMAAERPDPVVLVVNGDEDDVRRSADNRP